MSRKYLAIILVLSIVLAAAVLFLSRLRPVYRFRAAGVSSGYAAKTLCSEVFISRRTPPDVWQHELKTLSDNFFCGSVDYVDRTVNTRFLGFLFNRTAVYRGPCGCSLELPGVAPDFRDQCVTASTPPPPEPAPSSPTGDAPVDTAGDNPDSTPGDTAAPAGLDRPALDEAVGWAFEEKNHSRPVHTRAVIVLYNGSIVAERYAPGITADTPLPGYSMAKSVTGALVGILVGQGRLDVNRPAPVPEWSSPGDPRGQITLDHLLHLTSGLEFTEICTNRPDCDGPSMFFNTVDMAEYAAARGLETPPGAHWKYSGGSMLVLAGVIRRAVGGSFADYLAFPRRELFDKLGMRSPVMETDPSGTVIGATFMFATARDWARFGQLYLQDGVWNGVRILPEGWVEYSRTPSRAKPTYGALWWLNRDGMKWPDCPADAYSAEGYNGQFLTIVPSRRVVIVRLGRTDNEAKNWDHNRFVRDVLAALPPGPG